MSTGEQSQLCDTTLYSWYPGELISLVNTLEDARNLHGSVWMLGLCVLVILRHYETLACPSMCGQ